MPWFDAIILTELAAFHFCAGVMSPDGNIAKLFKAVATAYFTVAMLLLFNGGS